MLAEFPEDGTPLLTFSVGGALVVVSEKEMVGLLSQDTRLWVQGIARGKAFKRAKAMAGRQAGGGRPPTRKE